MLCLLLHVTFVCCLLSLDVTFASIFKSHMYHKTLHEHTRMSHRLLLLSWSFSPLLFSLLSVEKWSHTLKIYLLVICEVLRAVFSYQWVLQSFAMPGFTRWPKGEPDTEHSWTHYEPELSIKSFSQLLNTSSCPSENSEVREEDCQNSDRLHISIPVPLASFNHCCTCTPGQKQSPTR